MLAAIGGHESTVEALLQHGSDVTASKVVSLSAVVSLNLFYANTPKFCRFISRKGGLRCTWQQHTAERAW